MNNMTQAGWDKLTADEQLEYAQLLEDLVYSRDRMIKAIPNCELHDVLCVPHALEWIEKAKKVMGDE